MRRLDHEGHQGRLPQPGSNAAAGHLVRFIEALIESERGRIQGWKGYKLVGRGYTVCERILPLNFKALEQRLLQEFNQLRELEGAIDQTLTRLEGKA
jgi:hypothetical protein